jgi:hypothetical protein
VRAQHDLFALRPSSHADGAGKTHLIRDLAHDLPAPPVPLVPREIALHVRVRAVDVGDGGGCVCGLREEGADGPLVYLNGSVWYEIWQRQGWARSHAHAP